MWRTNFSGSVSIIETATHTVIDTVAVGHEALGVAVHPKGTFVYVAGSNRVSVINTATKTVIATVFVGGSALGLAVHPTGAVVYVGNSCQISVIDTVDYLVIDVIPVSCIAQGMVLNPTGTRLYVATTMLQRVYVIDTASNTVIDTVSVGLRPFGLAVHPRGTFVYLVIPGQNTLVVINTATNTIVGRVSVGSSPVAFGQFIASGYSLKWPLRGTLRERTKLLRFGDDGVTLCNGVIKKHVGLDVSAVTGEDVYAAETGIVRAIVDGGPTWKFAVTLEHPTAVPIFTTVYWHVDPIVQLGRTVAKGQRIATIADLGGNTHFHIGVRRSSYTNISNRGGLPQTACEGDPPFPELFIDPETIFYESHPLPQLVLTLTGCQKCRTGDTLSAQVIVTNPGATPVSVEIKAGVMTPDGTEFAASVLRDKHFEVSLPPGFERSVEILRVTIPDGLPKGPWVYEGALLSPELGRTLVRAAKPFTIQ